MDFDWGKFHDFTKKYDPLGHYAVDHAWKSSTRLVNQGAKAVGWDWLENASDKDKHSIDRWAENTLGSVGAVFGGMYAAGALGGGGAGAAGSGAAGGGAGAGATGGVAGAEAGAGAAGSAEYLAAADAAGGLVPEYGTTASYNAGMNPSASSAAGTNWQDMVQMKPGGNAANDSSSDDARKRHEERRRQDEQERLALALRRHSQTTNPAASWMQMQRAA